MRLNQLNRLGHKTTKNNKDLKQKKKTKQNKTKKKKQILSALNGASKPWRRTIEYSVYEKRDLIKFQHIFTQKRKNPRDRVPLTVYRSDQKEVKVSSICRNIFPIIVPLYTVQKWK